METIVVVLETITKNKLAGGNTMRQTLFAVAMIPAFTSMVLAEPTENIRRPEARPSSIFIVATASRAIESASRLDTTATLSPGSFGIARSLRPRPRPKTLMQGGNVTPSAVATTPAPQGETVANPAFDRWLRGFRSRALSKGISARVFDAAFAHAGFMPKVIKRDRNQSEFTLSVGDYLGRAASDSRVTNGRANAAKHATTLAAIESKYGVSKHIVAAIWGMESNYGANRGDTHLMSALATLSFEGRRGRFFEKQLIAALRILQSGDTTENLMTASWAGAMGHTQFIPTSYLAYAVDFTGDGKRDIWSDDPTDALASTAAYLARAGWVKGMPWGVEVRLPKGFDFAKSADKRMPSDWARLGVKATNGAPVPNHGTARLLFPAGSAGPAFLVFKNFDVIKRYNASDAYALGVGHLGDRIAGAGPLAGTWPQGERSLRRSEARELQSLLSRAGFSTGGVDGRIGGKTIAAIRAYQTAAGLPADGYPSMALLGRLRR